MNDIVAISGNNRHFLALRQDRKVIEFDEKLSIELGAAIHPGIIIPCAALPAIDMMAKPKVVLPISDAIAIATTQITNEVLERNGFVYAWGGGQLNALKDWRGTGGDWLNIRRTFIGTDKTSISLSDYLIALSRDGKAYYWGDCRSTREGAKGIHMEGISDNISDISKIVAFGGGNNLNSYLLSDGKMVLVLPPVPASADTDCSMQFIFSQNFPIFVSHMPAKIIDAAFPAAVLDMANFSILMVGSDGSLWKIDAARYRGGLANLTNINLPSTGSRHAVAT